MKEDEVESEEKSGQFSTGFHFLLNRSTDFSDQAMRTDLANCST